MRFAVLVVALALSACKSHLPAAPTGPVDRRVVLAPGEAVIVAEAGIALRFERVTEDSRCPANALCVWAGDAIVRIAVQVTGQVFASYDLHLVSQKPVEHGDLTFALEALTPYPLIPFRIAPGDYRATIRVRRS